MPKKGETLEQMIKRRQDELRAAKTRGVRVPDMQPSDDPMPSGITSPMVAFVGVLTLGVVMIFIGAMLIK